MLEPHFTSIAPISRARSPSLPLVHTRIATVRLPEPACCRRVRRWSPCKAIGRAIQQHVNRLTAFQIDEDSPVALALASRPVISTDCLDAGSGPFLSDRSCLVAKRLVTDRQHPFGRKTLKPLTGLRHSIPEPPGALERQGCAYCTGPGFSGCLYWRWLPLVFTRLQPSLSTDLMRSRTSSLTRIATLTGVLCCPYDIHAEHPSWDASQRSESPTMASFPIRWCGYPRI